MEKKSFFYMDEIHFPIILLDILKNGWVAILVAISVCIGVFAYGNTQHQPVYTTEATFVVSPKSNGSYVGFYSSLSTANEMASVFKEVFSSDVLKRLIQDDLKKPGLSFGVTATVAKGTNILSVKVQSNSPENAHLVIQSLLRNYRQVSGYLFGGIVLDVLKNPQISVTPSNPFNFKKYMVLGVGMSVLMVVALIAFLSILRPTPKTLASAKRRMEEQPLSVLQKEKNFRMFRKHQKRPPLITDTRTSFQYTESLLQLTHKIQHKMKKDDMKVLLITSVTENEGKSTVSANISLALARHGYKVAYVDMDLRKPAVHKIFRELPRENLATCLHDGLPASLDSSKRLHILSHEHTDSASDKLLHSKELEKLLNTLREKMDFVILDSSPYTATADTGMLLNHADCCVMVIRQDWVSSQVCRDVADDLGDGKAKYLGYVINHYIDNGTAQTFNKRYGNYGYYKKSQFD